ncbi:MAG: amidohydrolase [Rhodobacteraceae bacterium]|nr:amidohydrolase [Paracoccaceae bacterium]
MTETTLIEQMRNWRHLLHQNPEFGHQETQTAAFIVDKLRSFGISNVKTGIGKTGIVASLRIGSSDRTIALRADMDCLPIHETTNLPYSSKKPNLIHFVFQPAEEWGQGMQSMIADGLGSTIKFDEIYGLHNMPGLPIGQFETRAGAFMGAEDGFVITVYGTGGHASRPHECNDAIVCACSVVNELQTVVSRNVDPADLAVVSVTSIAGDNVKNAISSTARIEGDCRHFSDEVSQKVESAIKRIAIGIAAAHGCTADVTYDRVFVPLINDADSVDHCVTAANTIFGPDNVNANGAPMGASEDFARALTLAPGAFAIIGNGDSAPLHNSGYDFNDDALAYGMDWFVELVRQRLKPKT